MAAEIVALGNQRVDVTGRTSRSREDTQYGTHISSGATFRALTGPANPGLKPWAALSSRFAASPTASWRPCCLTGLGGQDPSLQGFCRKQFAHSFNRLFEPHQPELCGFYPNTFLDITSAFEKKQAAMEVMRAQGYLRDY